MSWSLKPRTAVVLPLLALSVLTVSVLYSQIPGVTVISVGTEPRGLAINPELISGTDQGSRPVFAIEIA